MQFRRTTRTRDSEAAILPLTNVVFLLLIFFLLAGRIADPSAFSITPPTSTSRTALQARGLQIELARDGRLAVAGKPTSLEDLATAVSRARDGRDLPVQLKADGRESAARVVRVMQILHQADVQRLRLITTAKQNR